MLTTLAETLDLMAADLAAFRKDLGRLKAGDSLESAEAALQLDRARCGLAKARLTLRAALRAQERGDTTLFSRGSK